MTDKFSVYQFIKKAGSECVARGVSDRDAVEIAHSYCARPAALMGIIERVIITDEGDCIVFEWKDGAVTYPPQSAGRVARQRRSAVPLREPLPVRGLRHRVG